MSNQRLLASPSLSGAEVLCAHRALSPSWKPPPHLFLNTLLCPPSLFTLAIMRPHVIYVWVPFPQTTRIPPRRQGWTWLRLLPAPRLPFPLYKYSWGLFLLPHDPFGCRAESTLYPPQRTVLIGPDIMTDKWDLLLRFFPSFFFLLLLAPLPSSPSFSLAKKLFCFFLFLVLPPGFER